MKSILGFVFAAAVALAFGVAWRFATREGASFFDQQWLFAVALPYNLAIVKLFGQSDFSADAYGPLAGAIALEGGAAYILGAALQACARALWRGARRLRARA